MLVWGSLLKNYRFDSPVHNGLYLSHVTLQKLKIRISEMVSSGAPVLPKAPSPVFFHVCFINL
jgi:hypothetical protein